MTYNDYVFKLLLELSASNNFSVKGFSQNYIIEVSNNKDKFYIYGNCFPLNDASSQKLCADKSALSMVLKLNDVNCLEHELYKNPDYDPTFNINLIENKLKENPKGLVLKDNKGYCGNNVFWVKNKTQIKKAVNKIFKQNLDLAVCPYVDIEDEFRLIMLNGECKVCYKKVRPYVIGDGKLNVKNLIAKKYKDIKFDLPFKTLNTTPNKNEKIVLGWKHNLKWHSTPEEVVDKKLEKKLIEFAKKVVKTINLKFCSVDLYIEDDKIKVLETNSIVSMNSFANYLKENYNKTKQIFLEAVNASFNNI